MYLLITVILILVAFNTYLNNNIQKILLRMLEGSEQDRQMIKQQQIKQAQEIQKMMSTNLD